jgi:hypothetical protein
MKAVLVAAALIVVGFAGQTREAPAYPCKTSYYLNSAGHWVHSPSCGRKPIKRTAVCRDGSISHSKNRRGACSHHGGVARWIRS